MSSHEPVQSHRTIAASSDRAFGLAFACLFLIFAVWPWLRHGQPLRLSALTASAAFLALALFGEKFLAPLNRLWFKLGLKLHSIISPVIMGLLFLAPSRRWACSCVRLAMTSFDYALIMGGHTGSNAILLAPRTVR